MYFKVYIFLYLACYDSHECVLSFWSFISSFNSCFGDLINELIYLFVCECIKSVILKFLQVSWQSIHRCRQSH